MAIVMHDLIQLMSIFLFCVVVRTDSNNTTGIDNNNTTGIDNNNTTGIDSNSTGAEWFKYSANPSFEPSTGVAVGEDANLTCAFEYEKQSTDKITLWFSLDLIKAKSTNFGWTETIPLKAGYDHGYKTIICNRTIASFDNGTDLKCGIISPKVNYSVSTPLMFRSPTTNVRIDYKTNKTDNTCCNTNDVLNCSANGYPYPTITWKDQNGYNIQPYRSGNGISSVEVTKVGTYRWSCSASNQFSTGPVSTNIVIRNGGTANGVEFTILRGFHFLSLLYIGLRPMLLVIN